MSSANSYPCARLSQTSLMHLLCKKYSLIMFQVPAVCKAKKNFRAFDRPCDPRCEYVAYYQLHHGAFEENSEACLASRLL